MKRSAAARAALAVAVLVPVVLGAVLVGLSTGAGSLSLRDALQGREPDATVLFRLRIPRVIPWPTPSSSGSRAARPSAPPS